MIGKSYKIKSFSIFLFFFILMLFMGYRLFSVQVFGFNRFATKARDIHEIEIQLIPKRGDICDRNNNVLAMSVPMPSLYADPKEIENPDETAEKLSKVISLDKRFIKDRLVKDKRFVWLKRKMNLEEKEKVTALKIKGLNFIDEPTRFYPKDRLAAHILGFVNIDNEGMESIELSFDEYLKGKPGLRVTERDAQGREILSWRCKEIPPEDGYKLILTIDEMIQYIVEDELDKAMYTFNSKAAMCIVMDPSTGEVLALADRPAYNPNKSGETEKDAMRNRAIADCFEPGSVLKMFVASGALNEKIFSLKDSIFCENGAWAVPGGVLHDHSPHSMLTFQQVVEKSSNIGMAKVGVRLGGQKVYEYLTSFGFGKPTGISLPGEVSGMFNSPNRWSKMSITRIPMGHEIAITAIQLANATCTIANGGRLLRPRIVKRILDSKDRIVKEFSVEVEREVISKEASERIKIALKGVVSPEGTAVRASLKEFSAAGKTGTAQKINPDGTYSHSDFVASFSGFVPADNPRIVIAVILDSPKPMYYGGVTAAPIFRNIAEKVLEYLNVEPEFGPCETLVAKNTADISGSAED